MITLTLIETIPLLREASARLLSSENELVLKIASKNFPESLTGDPPDILWLDGNLSVVQEPGMIKKLRKKYPDMQVIVFGSTDSIPVIKKKFLQTGCLGVPSQNNPC